MSLEAAIGTPLIVTTQNRGMSSDEWVELALNRIVSVSEKAPMPIREQALAFRDDLRAVLSFYFKRVAKTERTTIANLLRKEGYNQIADKVVDIE
jgi:uncharacterized membrane protein